MNFFVARVACELLVSFEVLAVEAVFANALLVKAIKSEGFDYSVARDKFIDVEILKIIAADSKLFHKLTEDRGLAFVEEVGGEPIRH